MDAGGASAAAIADGYPTGNEWNRLLCVIAAAEMIGEVCGTEIQAVVGVASGRRDMSRL